MNKEIYQEEQQPCPLQQCNNLAESTNDGSSDEEGDDGTICKICKIPWIELTEKCRDWVQYNTCDKYISPKCYGKRDISLNDDLFV